MRRPVRTAFALALSWAAVAAAGGDDNTLPADPVEALERATPAIEAARKANSAETKEIAKGIRRAVDLMQPHVKKGSADESWSAIWNEALTLTRFHGNKPTGEYILTSAVISTGADAVRGGGIAYGVPVGRGWRYQPGRSGPNVQSIGQIQRTQSDGNMAATVRVSVYWFNGTYSGVGGENGAGLADIFFDVHRSQMSKLESRSPQVTAKLLSKGFPRANYFEIVGTSKTEGDMRMRAYFAKTSSQTYEFDAIEYRGTTEGETPAAAWQRNVQDPELEAVLASIAEAEPKKPR